MSTLKIERVSFNSESTTYLFQNNLIWDGSIDPQILYCLTNGSILIFFYLFLDVFGTEKDEHYDCWWVFWEVPWGEEEIWWWNSQWFLGILNRKWKQRAAWNACFDICPIKIHLFYFSFWGILFPVFPLVLGASRCITMHLKTWNGFCYCSFFLVG